MQTGIILDGLETYPDLVVVSGAGRGIGRAMAQDLAKTSFLLCISQSEKALETAHALRASGCHAEGLVLDLADFATAESTVRDWVQKSCYRRIGAVLAAGILGPRGPLSCSDLHDWHRTFQINVLGNLAVARALIPSQTENQFGRLLFLAGGGAAYAYPAFPAYAASKTALVRIVENLHEDLKDAGDFATAILAPGAVETDMLTAVRASGAEVRTTVGIEEPVAFARAFMTAGHCGFSGGFVHVRDEWSKYLRSEESAVSGDRWKLRRVP